MSCVGEISHMSFGPHHAALVVDGKVYTYGVGDKNELGLGEPKSVETPTLVEGLENVIQVECGKHHTMALTGGICFRPRHACICVLYGTTTQD